MKQIRKGVFETNSSSVHSLSISNLDRIQDAGVMYGTFGEFGWGYETLSTPQERLSYLLVALANLSGANMYNVKFEEGKRLLLDSNQFKWTEEIIREKTGDGIVFDWESISNEKYYPFGYIDHQSVDYNSGVPDVLLDFWSDEKDIFCKNMFDFIFNDKYTVSIDNDNH